MHSSSTGTKVMGWMLLLSGAYIIGEFWIIVGVLFMIWGSSMVLTQPRRHKRQPVKDWLGNVHLED